jgi:hypothetical protein
VPAVSGQRILLAVITMGGQITDIFSDTSYSALRDALAGTIRASGRNTFAQL